LENIKLSLNEIKIEEDDNITMIVKVNIYKYKLSKYINLLKF